MLSFATIPKIVKSSNRFLCHYSSEYTKTFLLPAAERLVALNGLDASKITGTGLGGRIMRYDVVNYMESLKKGVKNPSKPTKKVSTPVMNTGVNYVDEPVSEEKKPQVEIDQQLKKVIPHAYSIGDMDLCKTVKYIQTIGSLAGETITTTDIAIKAVSNALMQKQSFSVVDLNICLGIAFGVSKTFTISNVQDKTLLDIHKAVEEGKKAQTSSLSGIATVCCLDDVLSAGGILSSPNELATFTVGSPYRTVCVNDEDQPQACTRARIHIAYNATKLNEVSSNDLLESIKKYMENPEFLLE